MPESEWLSGDLNQMWKVLKRRKYPRKGRLIAVATCRRIWGLLSDERSRLAVVTAERYADGEATRAELAATGCIVAVRMQGGDDFRGRAANMAAEAARFAAHWDGPIQGSTSATLSTNAAGWAAGPDRRRHAQRDEEAAQIGLLRCVFGNPFRRVTASAEWVTPTVRSLAETAYADRDLPAGTLKEERLLTLADALEQAGCKKPELLAHLRTGGPHVRGCHVIDLLLGLE